MIDKNSLLLKVASSSWSSSQKNISDYNIAKGKEGERLTREVLNAWGTIYFSIEQQNDTMPSWISAIKGKRPDFIAFTGSNEIILIDSKFYKNNNGFIYLECEEVTKYEHLSNQLSKIGLNVDVLFIFPIGGMAGHNFFAFSLDSVQSAPEEKISNVCYKQLNATSAFKK